MEVYGPRSIVCFYADGNTKYYAMSINAIQSFLSNSTIPYVGILVPNEAIRLEVSSKLSSEDMSRVRFKMTSAEPHLAAWNPTQHKLDIALFADDFDYVFWMDADTITVANVDYFFKEFVSTSYKFWFIPDHSLADSVFVDNWKSTFQVSPFVPQACFMGFKSSILKQFFDIWKSKWQQWIFPSPFNRFPDPRPHFPGSEFCTEQYALGNSIEQFEAENKSAREDIFVISRTTLPLMVQYELIRQIDPDNFASAATETSSSAYYLSSAPMVSPTTIMENGLRAIHVDNILSGSVIHTFGVNNAVILGLYFDSQLAMTDELRNNLLEDVRSKTGSRLTHHLLKAFEDDRWKDVDLYIRQGSVRVHKSVIEVLCPKLLESTYDVETSLDTFTVFLKLVYLQDLDNLATLENITELLSLAFRFEVSELVSGLKLQLWKLTDGSFTLYESYLSKLNPELSPDSCSTGTQDCFSLFDALYEGRNESGDFTIHLEGGSANVRVHKWILCKWPLFEESLAFFEFNSHLLPLDTFQKLVKYYYTEDVSLFSNADCEAIVQNADELKIAYELRNYCFHAWKL